ncbi:hypothetical protein Cni_G22205 [Canna indica]|uniref:Uncharacterized protein n=1 Tax=Canna indica TaxID=4628 RepID=A0AAQ3KRH0_9LILI|nr:hypothetical protein Cni_G22205 [Canna indica]
MGIDHLWIALKCEKKVTDKTKLIEEHVWMAFINRRKIGYAVQRELSEYDLEIMQLLYMVSMGADVLLDDMTGPVEGKMTYMRAHFDWLVGNKDSETVYVLNPDGNNGHELSIFFARV